MGERMLKDWRAAFGMQHWKPPHFFSSKMEIDATAPQPHAMRRAFDRLSLSGVLCLHGNAVAYFKEVAKIRPEQVFELHKQFWNQGLAPILVLVDELDVHVYSGLVRPLDGNAPARIDNALVQRLNRVSDEAAIRHILLSIESGDYFRVHAKAFDPNQRVDRDLLRNLKATRTALASTASRRLPATTLDALLCRIVFVCYLFDRGVIGESYLESTGIKGASHLRDILRLESGRAKTSLYKLFKRLGDDFNGDLFSEDLTAEARHIGATHLGLLSAFLQGTDVAAGQAAFWPYDFSMIPIETISAIYEHFLKVEDPDAKKKTGAFYTPRFLAEVTLDLALEGIGTLLNKKFLDPSCGSGIFLVGLFNRLAEEWKRGNPSARYDRRANALIAILHDNLAGVDVNPTACRIAAFSLYLALLDQLSPPDIQELQRKGKFLPKLVGSIDEDADGQRSTILCGDFFSKGLIVADADVLVGNPPWASLTGDEAAAETWAQENDSPIPNRQLAAAFVWKAARHQAPGGRVCFVLPHGVLFNHQRKAVEFQKAWLERHAIDTVLNLSDMRFNLFDGAVGPALIVRYGREAASRGHSRARYLVPKTSWSISQAELVAVVPEDRAEVALDDVLRDLKAGRPTTAWKQRFWGTPRDWKFLDRLGDLPPLSQIVGQHQSRDNKRWIIAEGIQPVGPSDDPDEAKDVVLPSKWFVPARRVGKQVVLAHADCEKLADASFTVRSGSNTSTEVFRGPHVLVTKGLNVSFADFAASFRHAVRGIHGPKEDRNLLLFLTAYLRSPVARYFLFHTSSRWGVERSEVEVAELLKVPFPLPEQMPNPREAHRIVAAVAREIDAYATANHAVLADREGALASLEGKCTSLLYEYFDFIEEEQVLIEDTNRIVIESVLPTRASTDVPSLRIPSAATRQEYIDQLCKTLNDWAKGGRYRVGGRVHASLSTGIATVVLERASSGSGVCLSDNDDQAMMSVLERLRKTFAKELGSVELLRGVKVFDKDTLYLFKSLSQRFWSRTAALNDADDIAATVLLAKERA